MFSDYRRLLLQKKDNLIVDNQADFLSYQNKDFPTSSLNRLEAFQDLPILSLFVFGNRLVSLSILGWRFLTNNNFSLRISNDHVALRKRL